MLSKLILLALWVATTQAGFDFGNGSSGNDSNGANSSDLCDANADTSGGRVDFNKDIKRAELAFVATIPKGVNGVEVIMLSNVDLDLYLIPTASSENFLGWSGEQTKTYNGDTITYSGYYGDGGGYGNEVVKFSGVTRNEYNLYAYGYEAGFGMVEYSWSDKELGCTPENGGREADHQPKPSGKGIFLQNIERNATETVGTIPAGAKDVYVRIDCSFDVDIHLFEGSKAIVNKNGGLLEGKETPVCLFTWRSIAVTDPKLGILLQVENSRESSTTA